eukprot:4384-Heterococcus_DN1.PRE.1
MTLERALHYHHVMLLYFATLHYVRIRNNRAVLERTVSNAKRDGSFEDGIVTLTGGSVVMQNRRPIDVKLAGYGPDDLVAWEVLVDKGMTYEKIVPLSQDAIKKAKDAEKLAKQQAAASTTTSKSKWAQQKYSGTVLLLLLFCCNTASVGTLTATTTTLHYPPSSQVSQQALSCTECLAPLSCSAMLTACATLLRTPCLQPHLHTAGYTRRLYTGFFLSSTKYRGRHHVIFCIDPLVGAATSAVGSAGSLIAFRAYRGRFSMQRANITDYSSLDAGDRRIKQLWNAEFNDTNNVMQQRVQSVSSCTACRKLFPVWSAVEGAILKVEGSKGTKVRVTVVQECGEEFDPEEEGGEDRTPKTMIALKLPDFRLDHLCKHGARLVQLTLHKRQQLSLACALHIASNVTTGTPVVLLCTAAHALCTLQQPQSMH